MKKESNLKRNNISFILDNIYISIKSMWYLIFLFLSGLKENPIIAISIFTVIFILFPIYGWIVKKFEVKEKSIIYSVGLINKRIIEIPFDKVTTIDIKKNIIDRIFKVVTLKIDSGAILNVGQEIKLKLKAKEGYEIRNLINNSVIKDIDNENSEVNETNIDINNIMKKVSFKDICIYTLSKSKLLFLITSFFLVSEFISNIDEISNFGIMKKIENEISFEWINSVDLLKLILLAIGIYIVLYIFINIIYTLFEWVKLYDFTLYKGDNDIKIKYGLLTVKEYSIPKDKIYAIILKQSFILQLINKYSIEVITSGYGDEQNEQALIYPIASKEFINNELSKIIPELIISEEGSKPSKKVLDRFIVFRSIILIAFILPIFILLPNDILILKLLVSLILIIYNIILGYINYKNTSLFINKDIIISSSGNIKKLTTIVKQEFLEGIEIRDNMFLRRRNICHYKFHIYRTAISITNLVKVKNMDKDLIKDIEENLVL